MTTGRGRGATWLGVEGGARNALHISALRQGPALTRGTARTPGHGDDGSHAGTPFPDPTAVRARRSQEAQLLEARITGMADDDMVQHVDAD